jgi:hypothetical protein
MRENHPRSAQQQLPRLFAAQRLPDRLTRRSLPQILLKVGACQRPASIEAVPNGVIGARMWNPCSVATTAKIECGRIFKVLRYAWALWTWVLRACRRGYPGHAHLGFAPPQVPRRRGHALVSLRRGDDFGASCRQWAMLLGARTCAPPSAYSRALGAAHHWVHGRRRLKRATAHHNALPLPARNSVTLRPSITGLTML